MRNHYNHLLGVHRQNISFGARAFGIQYLHLRLGILYQFFTYLDTLIDFGLISVTTHCYMCVCHTSLKDLLTYLLTSHSSVSSAFQHLKRLPVSLFRSLTTSQQCVLWRSSGMTFYIPIPSHSHMVNSHSFPFPFPNNHHGLAVTVRYD